MGKSQSKNQIDPKVKKEDPENKQDLDDSQISTLIKDQLNQSKFNNEKDQNDEEIEKKIKEKLELDEIPYKIDPKKTISQKEASKLIEAFKSHPIFTEFTSQDL